ncbi:MAG: dockerin type I repeat-containing protein [Muribaculaceae bacterium]|nr:dockerin type I repeat-containing protein [Muribaculaceae bacterium]
MKVLLSLCAMLLAAAGTASADNYFTLRADDAVAVNDTLRLRPEYPGQTLQVYASAHFDGYLDHWYLTVIHPDNMTIHVDSLNPGSAITEGPALDVPYINADGNSDMHHAHLLTKSPNNAVDSHLESYFSSTITAYGYWDPFNNGSYQSYGTIKWGPDTQGAMFRFAFDIPAGVTDADIILNAMLTSTPDRRGIYTVNMNPCVKKIHIHVENMAGDVDGDGSVTIADVTELIDLLLNGEASQGEDIENAADVDGDGSVTIADVTALIDRILLAS